MTTTPVTDVFVVRQPIFDRKHDLGAYELLYRAKVRSAAGEGADASATGGATLVNSVLSIGLEALTGGVHAYIGFTREQLRARAFEVLSPERCTIGLFESTECDAEMIALCGDLRAAGFRLALDDSASGDEHRALLKLAHVIKIDVLHRNEAELAATVKRLRPFGAQLVAERVENAAMYAVCRGLGFSLFQGSYFSRPETMQRRDLPARFSTVAKLMNVVADDDVTDREIEDAFRADPGLSLKLLRIANSAAFGTSGIATIGQAIKMVGRGPLHRWLALLFANSAPRDTGVNTELILNALERGRLCEIMAERSGRTSSASALFLVGLLSGFDVILGVSMPELLHNLHVAPEVEAALLGDEGPFTPHLAVASACVQGDLDRVLELSELMGITEELPAWYVDASGWARGMLAAA